MRNGVGAIGLVVLALGSWGASARAQVPRDTTQFIGIYDPRISVSIPSQYLRATGVLPASVLDFGAKGDSVTDDTDAIQAALNFAIANSGTTNATPLNPWFNEVLFPATRRCYRVSRPLRMTAVLNQQGFTVRLRGVGRSEIDIAGANGEPNGWGTRLCYSGTSGDLLFVGIPTAAAVNVRIQLDIDHLTFIGNKNVAGATAGGGLHFQSLNGTSDVHSTLKDVTVLAAKDNGIWLDGTNNVQWFHVQSNQNGARGLLVSPQVGTVWSPESRIYSLECSSNGSHGMEVQSGSGNTTIYGFTANFNTGKGLVNVATGMRFYGLETEVNTAQPQIDLSSSNNVSIFGAQIVYTASTDTGITISGFGNAIYGLFTNSAANQIDVEFLTGNANHNYVQNWQPGDLVFTSSHFRDTGYRNVVKFGNEVVSGMIAADGNATTSGAGSPVTLKSATIPGGTLSAAGRMVRIRAWGHTANNANAKSASVVLAGTTLITISETVSAADNWQCDVIVAFRAAGASAQSVAGTCIQGATATVSTAAVSTVTFDPVAAQTVSVSVTQVAAGDMIQDGLLVESLP